MTAQVFSALLAIVLGVGASVLYFAGTNWLLDTGLKDTRRNGQLVTRDKQRDAVRPWLFIAPALFLLGIYLVFPIVETLRLSFLDRTGNIFVGFSNYAWAFRDPEFLQSIGNNFLWLAIVPALATAFGLMVAVLADRVSWGHHRQIVDLHADGDLVCRRQCDLEVRV